MPASGASIYNLYTAQLQVSYTFDVWGLNRRAVESLQALADVQRFEVEAAYLALTSNVVVAAITEASLRGEIEATDQLIAINGKMLDLLKRRLDTGYSNGSDVAVQEAALAQAKATLPPLRKALAQQRDLLAALSGAYAGEGPRETFRLANLHLPVDLPVSLPSQLIEQRPDVRAATEQLHAASAQIGVATANLLAELHHQRQRRLLQYGLCRPDLAAESCSGSSPATPRKRYSTPAPCCISSRARATLTRRRRGLIAAR